VKIGAPVLVSCSVFVPVTADDGLYGSGERVPGGIPPMPLVGSIVQVAMFEP
jgi:hypothetical protein